MYHSSPEMSCKVFSSFVLTISIIRNKINHNQLIALNVKAQVFVKHLFSPIISLIIQRTRNTHFLFLPLGVGGDVCYICNTFDTGNIITKCGRHIQPTICMRNSLTHTQTHILHAHTPTAVGVIPSSLL